MQTYVTKVISLINRIIMDACTVSVRFSIDIMDVYEMDVRGWICVVLYGWCNLAYLTQIYSEEDFVLNFYVDVTFRKLWADSETFIWTY